MKYYQQLLVQWVISVINKPDLEDVATRDILETYLRNLDNTNYETQTLNP